jgi:hypothetical protein
MSASGYVHLEDCTVKKLTEKAALIEYGDEQHWIPLSQIADADELQEGDERTVSITQWLADQKGLS